MNNIDIAKGIVFQKLSIKKETFNDRLISQKKVYLLQGLGTDLGYSYNWYVRGPYSPVLAKYIYKNHDLLSDYDYSGIHLREEAARNIDTVNKMENDKPTDLDVASWYELLASMLFAFSNKSAWDVDTGKEDDVIKKLLEHKPQYSYDQCIDAVKTLKKNSYRAVE